MNNDRYTLIYGVHPFDTPSLVVDGVGKPHSTKDPTTVGNGVPSTFIGCLLPSITDINNL